jgi:hypothetical protein
VHEAAGKLRIKALCAYPGMDGAGNARAAAVVVNHGGVL